MKEKCYIRLFATEIILHNIADRLGEVMENRIQQGWTVIAHLRSNNVGWLHIYYFSAQ